MMPSPMLSPRADLSPSTSIAAAAARADHAAHEPVDEALAALSLLERLMPWAISLTVHGSMVMLAIFVVWVAARQKDALEEEATIVPGIRFSEKVGSREVGAIRGMPGDPMASMQIRSIDIQKAMKNPLGGGTGPGVGASVGKGVGNAKVEGLSSIIGSAGGAGSGNPNGNPFGPGVVGQGDGIFRNTGVIGDGPGNTNARKIVIVIDCSGSVLASMPFVVRELKKTLSQLSEMQSFSVLFFQNGQAVELPPKGLKRATDKAKSDAIDWLALEAGHIVPGGPTTPEQTIKTGLSYRPDLMVILSDNITGAGRYEVDQAVLLAQIAQANKPAAAKISTIQFLDPDRLAEFGKQPTLKLIAERTGGFYRFVSRRELGLE